MLELFRDTKAAAQIRAYGEQQGWSEDAIEHLLLNAYTQCCKYREVDGEGEERFGAQLFEMEAIHNNLHKFDIDSCFSWHNTPEGSNYWAAIHRVNVKVPKRHHP